MKILHVVSSYWPAFEFGGPINSVHVLNKFLAGKGVKLTVYTTDAGLKENKEIPLKKEVDLNGVKTFYFPYYGYVHWTFSPSLFFALAKNVKNFDIVHITGVWNFPILAAAFWARIYKKPYIISPRGSLMIEPLNKKSRLKKKAFLSLFVRRFLADAGAIHFTVEMEKEEYLKVGLPFKKFAVIPNSIDFEDFDSGLKEAVSVNFKKNIGITPDKKIILFLSRFDWKKGLDTLIPASAEVVRKKTDSVLVLVGPDSEYRKNVENFIDAAKIRDKVIFTGMLTGAKRIAAFKSADVFVLPSYSENFGMVVAEAMYFGLPVIITKYVGIAPEIAKSNAGIIIEKNEKELSEAILKVLNNPDMARKMGEQGKELVKREFSPKAVADRFMELYNDTYNGRRIL